MAETKITHPFRHYHAHACTVAVYGQNDPIIFRGNLVFRTYYTDDTMQEVDTARTSRYLCDTMFYETNKVIREQLEDPYNGKRELIDLSLPELGKQYRIVYNAAEVPSARYDDLLTLVLDRDPSARGVAIILKVSDDNGLTYLEEAEARYLAKILAS
ncbi:MAG: hypothetical protein IKS37_05275 [Solobacterium sp.]|jgi:hypothetical protein|nr:hypothetical protein [Solobacterium sp.]